MKNNIAVKFLLTMIVIVVSGYVYYKVQTTTNPNTSMRVEETALSENERESSSSDLDIVPDSIVPKQKTAIILKRSLKENVVRQQKTKDESDTFQLFEDSIAEDFKGKNEYTGKVYDSDDFFKNEGSFEMEKNSNNQDGDSLDE